MPSIAIQALPFVVTPNQRIPKEGPKVVPVVVRFSQGTDFDLDMLSFEQQVRVSMIQAMFIDNSGSDSPIAITAVLSQQTIVIAPRSQAYLPICLPVPSKLHFNSVGGVDLVCELMNWPVSPFVWKTQ
jgi:hypothetical protein